MYLKHTAPMYWCVS